MFRIETMYPNYVLEKTASYGTGNATDAIFIEYATHFRIGVNDFLNFSR